MPPTPRHQSHYQSSRKSGTNINVDQHTRTGKITNTIPRSALNNLQCGIHKIYRLLITPKQTMPND